MWRVVIPLVLTLLSVPERELLYEQDGWVMGMYSGRLYEGDSPTRCRDGAIVYVREGDLWRDGERLTATVEQERNPSCLVDILYDSGGYVWRYPGERLFEGSDPAEHEDGRIAYVDWFQAIRAVHVRDGDKVVIPYKTYASGSPSWGEDRLYFSGSTAWAWWDGMLHWSDYPGGTPCWTPEGVYYVWSDDWPQIMYHDQWDIYLDGKAVIPRATHPAW